MLAITISGEQDRKLLMRRDTARHPLNFARVVAGAAIGIASFVSPLLDKNAPSKAGTKHL
jgi:hypothetical protein